MSASVFGLAGVSRYLSGFTATLALGFVFAGSASAQTPAVEACTLPFPFPAEAIEARILMVSEVHGTQETFRLAGELACTFARSGAPVTVAIEMSRDEQGALDAYLKSDGGETARSALVSRPYWATSTLANVAALAMIERLRALGRPGASVSLIAIDASSADLTPPPTLTPEQEQGMRALLRKMGAAGEAQLPGMLNMLALTTVRDRIMARLLGDAVRRDPARRFVVLLGGAHINKSRGASYPGVDYDTMASLLVSDGISFTSLTTVFLEGSFWGCLINGGGNCGPHEFPKNLIGGQAAGRSPGVYLSSEFPGYDGLIVFERVTAAEPANPAAAANASRNSEGSAR